MNAFFFPRLGGIERRMFHVGRRLASRGHQMTVLAARMPGLPERETMDGIDVIRLPARQLPVPWDPPVVRTRGVADALRRLAPDVVELHYRWDPALTRGVEAGVSPTPLRPAVPWILTWHNMYGEGLGLLRALSLLNDRAYRARALAARRVVCVSECVRDDLARRGVGRGSLDPGGWIAAREATGDGRLVVVENGSQEPERGGPEWEADDGRSTPERPYAITVGRLTPEKGTAHCIRALARARADGADIDLYVCGRGPRREALGRLARRLGVATNVHFGGWVPEATKWRLMRGAFAMVHLAPFESYGIAVAEGVVAGLPVVAARVGGVAEVVRDAGILVPDRDPEAAGAALARLATDAPWRAEQARRARARAPQLSWDSVARRMEAVYSEAAAGPVVGAAAGSVAGWS